MTKEDKRLLVSQAANLFKLGLKVEMARNKLKKLVERGVPYDDPQMVKAYEHFVEVDNEWKACEAEHLLLRKKAENVKIP